MGKITYKALAVLLTYPNSELIQALDEIAHCLKQEKLLSRDYLKEIDHMIIVMRRDDLFNLQEIYVATFDQTPSLSLHLFEHIHGESRDRGPAMIDLGNMYAARGLKINRSELPDYLPVFLEYLSTLSQNDAKELLQLAILVIKKIGERLKSMNNHYHAIFDAIVHLAG